MADVLAVRDEFRLQEWAQIHRRCRESGLSNREFCRQNGIAEKTFYYWLKRLRETAVETQPQLVALEDVASDDMIHIRFGTAVLELPAKTDAAAIASLLQALQKAYGQMRTGKIRFGLMENSLADADRAARPIEGAADGIDYPTLIYDGPFSDIVSEGAPKGLGTGQIDPAQAVRLAADFVGESEQNAAFMQESGGPIPAYCVRVTRPDCVLQLAVTRQGGDILWMFPENAGFTARYGLEESKRAAQQFFSAHGYGEMRLTFWQMYGGMATLSYAAVQQGVVLYPDLIKLQVRLDTLEVVGLEARRYLSSHAPRQQLTPAVSREEAEGAVSERLSLRESQLCVIPLNRQEYLCWEFVGEYNDQTYYVYIDALNGRQRDIQRLVEGSDGPKAE